MAFAVLIALLLGIKQLGLRRMQTINGKLADITGRQLTNLQLARKALTISNDNNRIVLQIVLVENRALITPLLATKSENSKEITRLVNESESRCTSEQERQLISAVQKARKPYVDSYLRAIHLLVDEGKHDEAEAVMVKETLPLLLEYHAAWNEFVDFQKNEVDVAVQKAKSDYAKARRLTSLLVGLAVAVALWIALCVTYETAGDVNRELRRNEEHMRMAMEAAKIGFWDWDVVQDKQVWSDTAKALHGLPPDSAADFQVLMNSVHPDDRKMMEDLISPAIRGKTDLGLEFRVVWPDGSTHWRVTKRHAFYDETGRTTRMTGIVMNVDARKHAEERLHLQAAALEAAANGIVITDFHGTIMWVNQAFTTMTGYSKEEALGKNPRLLKSGEQSESYYAKLWSTISSGKVWKGEIVNRRKDGTNYTEEMTITPVAKDVRNSADRYFIAIKQDITERKRAEEELYDSRQMLQSILDAIPQRVFWKDRNCIYRGCNRALATDAGLDAATAIIGKSDFDLSWSAMAEHYRADDQLVMEQDSAKLNFQEHLSRPDGSMWWIQTSKLPLRDRNGKVTGVIGTYEDITDRKVSEERIQFLAYYDALTELPNRTLLQDRLAKTLAGARRRKDKVALLFLDLDGFKNINDSLGHSVGDLLLQDVAKRLKAWGREQDTVARVGGDEFLIVLDSVKAIPDAAVAAERLMDAMTAEFVVQGHSLSVGCSIGISIFPEHGADGETLIMNADAAMYSAKNNGRNNYEFFTADMNAQVVERLSLEHSLRSALEKEELFLVYQPQMDIVTGKITGFEALLRWQHPELGFVSPDKFIRIAENSGLIVPIGEWVLRTACTQSRKWQDEGLPAVPVAVNVSAIQFRQEGFCELIKRVLHETGLAPQYLELELTESLLLVHADMMLSVVRELKATGLRLAIDDFGTGYSSLSYLKQFPVSKLKIDRSFVRDVAVNPDDAAITTAIISMAKSLNLKVIAEGVENEAQMSFLRTHHCDEIQGYYFSKPLAPEDASLKIRGAEMRALSVGDGVG